MLFSSGDIMIGVAVWSQPSVRRMKKILEIELKNLHSANKLYDEYLVKPHYVKKKPKMQ